MRGIDLFIHVLGYTMMVFIITVAALVGMVYLGEWLHKKITGHYWHPGGRH